MTAPSSGEPLALGQPEWGEPQRRARPAAPVPPPGDDIVRLSTRRAARPASAAETSPAVSAVAALLARRAAHTEQPTRTTDSPSPVDALLERRAARNDLEDSR